MNNLIDDFHHKTGDFLTQTFNYIILPSFESQEMMKKNKMRFVTTKTLFVPTTNERKCELRDVLWICTEEYISKCMWFLRMFLVVVSVDW